MSDVKHTTPGPWEKDRHGQLRSPDGKQVIVWGAGLAWGSRDDEAEANSRLIAAAPELLEALKYARRYMGHEDHDTVWIDGIISKAEGRE